MIVEAQISNHKIMDASVNLKCSNEGCSYTADGDTHELLLSRPCKGKLLRNLKDYINFIIDFVLVVPFLPQPASTSKTILIDADTVRFYASFIHSSARVNVDDLTIQFGAGSSGEELLRVPIAVHGELLPQAMIRITVGVNPTASNHDPRIGITDGVHYNQFYLSDDPRFGSTPNPCQIAAAHGTHNGRTASQGNLAAGTCVLLFDPIHNFGTCSTNTGFATAGKFSNHVDPSKGLSLVLNRDSPGEQYTFHYFLVEFL